MTSAPIDPQRDWEGGWQQLDLTVDNDVWLVTERIKLKYLAPLLRPGMRALEVGCGSAKLAALLAARGLRVWGIDQSASGLRIARRNTDHLGATAAFARADAFTSATGLSISSPLETSQSSAFFKTPGTPCAYSGLEISSASCACTSNRR